MIKVGITGGIGSGKTTVCKVFESLGIAIYYADDRAKWLMQNDQALKTALQTAFGKDIYHPDGSLDRPKLAGLVFNNAEQLAVLNSLVHPAVFLDTEAWQAQQTLSEAPYTLREAALLIESGSYLVLDKLIVVTANEDLRIQRVMARDKSTADEVRARISKQLPDAEKVKLANFVIYNEGDMDSLNTQIMAIHKELLAG